jgi:CheY-like chemotaxis protein
MSSTPAHAMRVLVVDDYSDTVESAAILLGVEGHEVATANDGPEALARVAAFQPELVLLDLAMPGMDGFEVARQVQQLPLATAPYLVAVTGYGTPADRRRCAEAGFDLHLTKPIDLDAFRELPLLLDTSRRLAEHSRQLVIQNRALTTALTLQHLEMANLYLDSAAITGIDGRKELYVAHAKQACERVATWLQSGACTNDRMRAVAEALAALRQRLSS